MTGGRWWRGSGAYSRVTDAAGNVEFWVLKPHAWPPARAPFQHDKGMVDGTDDSGTHYTEHSPEYGAVAVPRFRRNAELAAAKPRTREPRSMRAPLAEVLKLVCADCHQPAGFFLAWRGSTTLDQIAAAGAWVPCSLPNACRCTWSAWPAVDQFRRQIATALGRGLRDRRAAVRVEHRRV